MAFHLRAIIHKSQRYFVLVDNQAKLIMFLQDRSQNDSSKKKQKAADFFFTCNNEAPIAEWDIISKFKLQLPYLQGN